MVSGRWSDDRRVLSPPGRVVEPILPTHERIDVIGALLLIGAVVVGFVSGVLWQGWWW